MRPLVKLVGIALVVIALFGVAYPIWWNHRSASGGHTLLDQATAQLMSKPTKAVSCPTSMAKATQPIGSTPGILEVPSIGLVAPVLNGLSDPVLNVAAGHDPQSTWPGGSGESILEAHDVSYFSNLSQVRAGAQVIWLTACARAQFKVVKTAVRQPGDLPYAPSGGSGLALVMCYPTNALFWTSNRFVVTTQLVSTKVGRQSLPATSAAAPKLTVPAPPALVAQGLALDQNTLLMGVMHLGGTPSKSFSSGPAPLSVEAQALEVFFGAKKAVNEKNHTWWTDLTVPGLSMPASWPSFGQANVSISISGLSPTQIVISSGAASATITVKNKVLLLSRITD